MQAKLLIRMLLIALSLIAFEARSQVWEFATSAEGGRYFYDPASIQGVDGVVRFIQLSNHPNGFNYDGKILYSIKTFRTVDCRLNKYKSEYLIGYSKIYGEGDIELVDKNNVERWVDESPDSTAYFMRLKVCAKLLGT